MTDRKTFKVTPTLEFKQGTPGLVTCRFATLNVVDSDGDVTLPGAFGNQTVRMQPYGHDTWALPIGKGAIREEGDAAIADLQINLEIGQQAYSALKFDMEHGPPAIEWSYVFDILEEERGKFDGQDVRFLKGLRVHSVDPVFLGAGVNTGTLSVKGKKCEDCGEPLEGDAPHDHTPTTFEEGHEKAAAALKDVAEFISRAAELDASLREKEQTLSTVKREALASVLASLKQSHDGLAELLKDPEEEKIAPRAAIVLRLSELERMRQQVGVH